MRPQLAALAGGTLLLAMTGCANDLAIDDAKPSGTRLDPPVDLTTVTPAQWPDACALLDDNEIAALLPEHKSIQRTPSPVTVLDTDFLDNQDLGGEAANGSCEFLADHGNGDYVEITITIEAVGSPGLVQAQYAADRNNALEQKTEHHTVKDVERTGARACFSSGTESYATLNCLHKWMFFEVGVTGLGTVPDVPEDHTTQALTKRLAPEVVRTVVAKLQ